MFRLFIGCGTLHSINPFGSARRKNMPQRQDAIKNNTRTARISPVSKSSPKPSTYLSHNW
jgi:hypothetical protein